MDKIQSSLLIFYFDFINDGYTIKKYSKYHCITEEECKILLDIGNKYRLLQAEYFEKFKTN
jgi:uncharacterized protein YfbU (UPF0304 family)